MPGTPLGVTVPAACRPAQSAGLVCPLCDSAGGGEVVQAGGLGALGALDDDLVDAGAVPGAGLVGPGRGGAERCAGGDDEGRDGGAGEGAGATLRRAGLVHGAQPRRGADLRQCDRATLHGGCRGPTPPPGVGCSGGCPGHRLSTQLWAQTRVGRPSAPTASTSRKVVATIAAARSASSRGRNGPSGTSSGQNRR